MSDFAVVTFNEVPDKPRTFKYDLLGELSLVNHRIYCERHGYDFVEMAAIDRSRPFCWAKLPAILDALQTHEWVLWADSDTLIFNPSVTLQDLCDASHDLVVQYQEDWWEMIGLKNGTERFPLNSGVFLVKSSPWSKKFLRDAYAQTQFVTGGEIWDGIGEQEAMNFLIRNQPEYRRRIKYLRGLQTSPKLYQPGDFIVHFYGNHARHYVPIHDCDKVFDRWKLAIEDGGALPDDLIKFHWCCIQNKSSDTSVVRGDLDHFLYSVEDLR